MRQYLMGLFVLALCCAAVEMLAPTGEGGALARHVKLMSALCLLCVLIAPVTALVRDGVDIKDGLQDWMSQWADGEQLKEDFADRWQEESERLDIAYAAEVLVQMLESEFEIAASDCRVELIVAPSGEMIEMVRVALSGRAVWVDTHKMEAYIRNTFGCESTIYIE